jgi:hypothetical protein
VPVGWSRSCAKHLANWAARLPAKPAERQTSSATATPRTAVRLRRSNASAPTQPATFLVGHGGPSAATDGRRRLDAITGEPVAEPKARAA